MVVSKGKFYMDSIRVVLKDLIDAEEILIKNGGDEQESRSTFSKTNDELTSGNELVNETLESIWT
jgi:hypothetical protein